MSLVDRLKAKILINDETGCWDWTAAKTHGYGVLKVGATRRAHRLSYEVHIGPIPRGMLVCHRCDNPGCINPDHLFLGSNADNTRDMIAKGRQRGQPRGSANTRAKLTEADVVAIRASEGATQRSLAGQYGVDPSVISHIRAGRRWSHLRGQ